VVATAAYFALTFSPGQTGVTLGGVGSSARYDQIKAMGAKWVRFGLMWRWVLPDNPTNYKWASIDPVVKGIADRGMEPLAVLSTTPSWARASGCTDSEWCAPASTRISDYAKFAAAAAKRYPQIHVWEIWNEPNHGPWWRPAPDPVRYTALLKAAYKAIKAVNPNAIVITGGTAPAVSNGKSMAAIEFLQKIYANGGGGSFDGVGHHPYCYDAKDTCPDLFAKWSAWSQMNDTNPSLRSLMKDHGDGNKKIWATEFGAPTGGGSRALTESQQAKMVTTAYELFRSYSWAAPILAWHKDVDRCTTSTNVECFFGLIRSNGSRKPAYDAFVQSGK
jgi:polysaccharide biosynthesis protein PslG